MDSSQVSIFYFQNICDHEYGGDLIDIIYSSNNDHFVVEGQYFFYCLYTWSSAKNSNRCSISFII